MRRVMQSEATSATCRFPRVLVHTLAMCCFQLRITHPDDIDLEAQISSQLMGCPRGMFTTRRCARHDISNLSRKLALCRIGKQARHAGKPQPQSSRSSPLPVPSISGSSGILAGVCAGFSMFSPVASVSCFAPSGLTAGPGMRRHSQKTPGEESKRERPGAAASTRACALVYPLLWYILCRNHCSHSQRIPIRIRPRDCHV